MTSAGLFGSTPLATQLDIAERAVRNGRIPIERIDEAVRRILSVKLVLHEGLCLRADGDERAPPADASSASSSVVCAPPPSPSPSDLAVLVGCEKHRETSRLAVAKSAVLLRNTGGLLPLSPSAESGVIVTGVGAHDLGMQCGGWSIEWQGLMGNGHTTGTTVWEGIEAARGKKAVHLPAHEAVEMLAAGGADRRGRPVVIAVVGEGPYAEGGGDTLDLTLEGRDVRMLLRLAESCGSDRRLVVVLLCGRPLCLPADVLGVIDALVVAWLPGTEGGDGIADVLFGRVPFSGRLSYAWPRSNAQAERRPRQSDPLFPLGFGLSTFTGKDPICMY